MSLIRVRSLYESETFVKEFARLASEDSVCEVCGLARMGHTPENEWLGNPKHAYEPVKATSETRELARELTHKAYRERCAKNLCGTYCQTTH